MSGCSGVSAATVLLALVALIHFVITVVLAVLVVRVRCRHRRGVVSGKEPEVQDISTVRDHDAVTYSRRIGQVELPDLDGRRETVSSPEDIPEKVPLSAVLPVPGLELECNQETCETKHARTVVELRKTSTSSMKQSSPFRRISSPLRSGRFSLTNFFGRRSMDLEAEAVNLMAPVTSPTEESSPSSLGERSSQRVLPSSEDSTPEHHCAIMPEGTPHHHIVAERTPQHNIVAEGTPQRHIAAEGTPQHNIVAEGTPQHIVTEGTLHINTEGTPHHHIAAEGTPCHNEASGTLAPPAIVILSATDGESQC